MRTSFKPIPDSAGAGVLTVNLSAICDNWRMLRDGGYPAECASVLKANGYGLGALEIAAALFAAGCRLFFVAHLTEAIDLRQQLPNAEIAVFNGLPPGAAAIFVQHSLIPVLNDWGQIAEWRQQGEHRLAILHVDTGIHRLGLLLEEVIQLSGSNVFEGIKWRAVISHLACADDPQHPLNAQQLRRFQNISKRLPNVPLSLAASSGIFLGQEYHFNIVRPGAALFGVNPQPGHINPMRQVVTLHCPIIGLADVNAGESVGYRATYDLHRMRRIATLPLGYADGWPIALSNVGWVIIAGVKAPVVGRVSMDMITVDVSEIPDQYLTIGAQAEILGPHLTVDEIAESAGTIGYEILCRLGGRFQRRFVFE